LRPEGAKGQEARVCEENLQAMSGSVIAVKRFALVAMMAIAACCLWTGTAHACVVPIGSVSCPGDPTPSPTPTQQPTQQPSQHPKPKPKPTPAAQHTPKAQPPVAAPVFTFPTPAPVATPSQTQTCYTCENRDPIGQSAYDYVPTYATGYNLFGIKAPQSGHDWYWLKVFLSLVLAAGGALWLRTARVRASMIGIDES
jgi:hypothetical protein